MSFGCLKCNQLLIQEKFPANSFLKYSFRFPEVYLPFLERNLMLTLVQTFEINFCIFSAFVKTRFYK